MVSIIQFSVLFFAAIAAFIFIGVTIAFIPVGGLAAPLLALFLIVGSASYLLVEAIIHNPRFFLASGVGCVAFFVGV